MNAALALGLFFSGSIVLIVVCLYIPLLEYDIGGIFVALFVAGVLVTVWNAARQGAKLNEAQKPARAEQIAAQEKASQ